MEVKKESQDFFYQMTASPKAILALSLPLVLLVIITSCTGIFIPDFYFKETPNWQAQSVGQDIIDLFLIIPCLVVISVFAYKGSETAMKLFGGVLLYLIYTFIIYCFNVHFNILFIAYCLALGLSFYSFIFCLFSQVEKNRTDKFSDIRPLKIIGIYFIVISSLFYLLWLADIVPSIIHNTIPKSLAEAGLFTNPVHVIDLSVLLPGIFITGVLLIRQHKIGLLMTPAVLLFFILMDITIGFLIVMIKMKGMEANLLLTVIMGVLALFSLVMLIWYLKSIVRQGKSV